MDEQNYGFFKTMNEQTISASNAVLRSLINGGAAVAVLAFFGNLAGNQTLNIKGNVADLTQPLLFFGWGVAFSVISMILAYCTHFMVTAHSVAAPEKEKRYACIKATFHILGVLTALASLACFVCGMYGVRASALTVLH